MKGNRTLYLFQGIACLLVVLIHIPFPGNLGIFFVSIARYAVPLFYMISGYTLYSCLETDSLKIKIKGRFQRNGKILAIAFICYCLFDCGKCLIKGKSILTFLGGMLNVPNVLRLFFLGIFPNQFAGGILWFMLGQLYIYLFVLVFSNHIKKHHIPLYTWISVAVLIIASCAKVCAVAFRLELWGVELSSYWIYGNWVVMGLPCFVLGIGFADYLKRKREIVVRTPLFTYILVIAISSVLNFVLCMMLNKFLNMYLSYTIFTLLIDYCAFAISQKERISSKNILAKIGCYHSRNVYIVHPAIISIFNIFFEKLTVPVKMGEFIEPVLVILATLGFSVVLNLIVKKISDIKTIMTGGTV